MATLSPFRLAAAAVRSSTEAASRNVFSRTSPHFRGVATRSTQFTLNTGAKIPAVGFGTFQDPDAQEAAVTLALNCGVRKIDTARVYNTEKQIGRGIKNSGVPRNEIFLATKLWCNDYHPDDVERAIDASLKDLDTDYVDLFLMHYPCTFTPSADKFPKGDDGLMIKGKTTYLDTWRAMEKLVKQGKTKAIGVSNFNQPEIQNLIDNSNTTPAVHQMEVHPYLQQGRFNAWLREKGVHVVQFSPLGNMNSFYRDIHWSKSASHTVGRVIDHPVLIEIGKKYNKSPIQIALAWGVNYGRTVIPKSVIDWQIRENLEADFELDAEDMAKIKTMNINARFNDPSVYYRWNLYEGEDGKEAVTIP
ncbi:alcohol dehydrogenase [Aulographum hederae CBS 113979]|uniref:Alcohol dehydrogenase n=1 Tax=Aulographum hederae CBS 113979 TaxID=1176131 RepID=A0A6G1H1N3_9PEZI|nr:alcohol dehydrogenase [Aulographum hederae CBS 113979]